MLEVLDQYAQVGPLWTGLLLAPLGLVVGSFCTVVRHRMARGESVVAPRSYCPSCRHTLGVLDLVPVLSYLWLRGRCRHCRAQIPAQYLALELACGVGTGVVGALGGWVAGFSMLLCCVAAAASASRRMKQEQAGVTLVEVLIAVALLAAVLVPMLDFASDIRGSTPFQRNMASSLAASKLEDLGNLAYRTAPGSWPSAGWDEVVVGRFTYHREWTVDPFTPTVDDYSAEGAQLKTARVMVTCTDCPKAMPPVRMVTILAKIYLSSLVPTVA